MSGLFAVLADDHGRILDLCNQLTGAPGDPLGTPEDRKRIADRLISVAARHEVAEEQVFWPAFRRYVPGADELVEEALHQEGGAKRLLHELDHTSSGNTDFAKLVSHVASALRDHITLEESQVWPKFRLEVGGDELGSLGVRLQRARAAAPPRPHPHTWANPRVLTAVGPVMAVMDRARDAMTGRSRHG